MGRVKAFDAVAVAKPAPTATIILFTGRVFDAETGLYYFRARYFEPELGCFVSRDPLGFVDGNSVYQGWFTPAFQIDPNGHKVIWIHFNFSSDGITFWQNRWITRIKKATDDNLNFLDGINEATFNNMVAAGYVKIDGSAFSGTKSEYRSLILREAEPAYIFTKSNQANEPYTAEGIKQTMLAYSKAADKDYDYVIMGAHGNAKKDGSHAFGNIQPFSENSSTIISKLPNFVNVVSCYLTDRARQEAVHLIMPYLSSTMEKSKNGVCAGLNFIPTKAQKLLFPAGYDGFTASVQLDIGDNGVDVVNLATVGANR